MFILSSIPGIRASVRVALILLMVTVFAVLVGGCASPNKYRPAEVVARGMSYAHLSNGYTDDEIVRAIDYPGRQSSDKIYFITYGHQSSGVSGGWERALAAYRATEIAEKQGFGGVILFPEGPPFERRDVLLRGGGVYSLDGTISSAGNITGVITRGPYLEVNLDRGVLGSAEHRWGAAYYAVLSKQCPYFPPQPYVKFTEPTKFSSRDPEPYIQSKICVPVIGLKNELLAVISKYLK